jgi:hypothetical protein
MFLRPPILVDATDVGVFVVAAAVVVIAIVIFVVPSVQSPSAHLLQQYRHDGGGVLLPPTRVTLHGDAEVGVRHDVALHQDEGIGLDDVLSVQLAEGAVVVVVVVASRSRCGGVGLRGMDGEKRQETKKAIGNATLTPRHWCNP